MVVGGGRDREEGQLGKASLRRWQLNRRLSGGGGQDRSHLWKGPGKSLPGGGKNKHLGRALSTEYQVSLMWCGNSKEASVVEPSQQGEGVKRCRWRCGMRAWTLSLPGEASRASKFVLAPSHCSLCLVDTSHPLIIATTPPGSFFVALPQLLPFPRASDCRRTDRCGRETGGRDP